MNLSRMSNNGGTRLVDDVIVLVMGMRARGDEGPIRGTVSRPEDAR